MATSLLLSKGAFFFLLNRKGCACVVETCSDGAERGLFSPLHMWKAVFVSYVLHEAQKAVLSCPVLLHLTQKVDRKRNESDMSIFLICFSPTRSKGKLEAARLITEPKGGAMFFPQSLADGERRNSSLPPPPHPQSLLIWKREKLLFPLKSEWHGPFSSFLSRAGDAQLFPLVSRARKKRRREGVLPLCRWRVSGSLA